MTERITNAQLATQLAAIQASMVTHKEMIELREAVAAQRQDIQNIKEQLPVFSRAADRTDVQTGRQIEADHAEVASRSDRAYGISVVSALAGVLALAISLTALFG